MFENEKEFEFDVCYDLRNKGISFKLLEEKEEKIKKQYGLLKIKLKHRK